MPQDINLFLKLYQLVCSTDILSGRMASFTCKQIVDDDISKPLFADSVLVGECKDRS
jgi:hypothetical protein